MNDNFLGKRGDASGMMRKIVQGMANVQMNRIIKERAENEELKRLAGKSAEEVEFLVNQAWNDGHSSGSLWSSGCP